MIEVNWGNATNMTSIPRGQTPADAQRIEALNREIWRNGIVPAYQKATHAFHYGCGIETMAYWVNGHRNPGVYRWSPKAIRRCLKWAVRKGWMISGKRWRVVPESANTPDMGYTCYYAVPGKLPRLK